MVRLPAICTCNECGVVVKRIGYTLGNQMGYLLCRQCALYLYPEEKDSIELQELYYV